MIIKKFIANTVQESIDLVRKELGPKAVILTSNYIEQKGIKAWFVPNRVEVTAGIEDVDLQEFTNKKMGKSAEGAQSTPFISSKKETKGEQDLNRTLEQMKKKLSGKVETIDQEDEVEATPTIERTPREKVTEVSAGTYGNSIVQKKRLKEKKLREQQLGVVKEVKTEQLEQRDLKKEVKAAEVRELEKEEEPKEEDLKKAGIGLVQHFMNKGKAQPKRDLVSLGNAEEAKRKQVLTSLEVKEKTVEKGKKKEGRVESSEVVKLKELRKMITEEVAKAKKEFSFQEDGGVLEVHNQVVQFLVSKGVDEKIATRIKNKVDLVYPNRNGAEKTQRINAIRKELAAILKTSGPICLKEGELKKVALVGPTGVGKTSTLMKLAGYYRLTLNKKVAVISADHVKVGGKEQIQQLGEQLCTPVALVSKPEQVSIALREYRDMDLVLFDTPGYSQYHRESVDHLADWLSRLDDVETHLVMSAATKDLDVYGIIQQFARVHVEHLIFTKLDETISHGLFVNVCQKIGKPIRYVTSGPRIPKDLEVADPEKISRNLLVHHNAPEFNKIRNLVKL